ncbi:speriolin-like protein isoform A [Alligator mississippiensis]|uniref:Speriolin-like protein isoform A n=1 Tax=Alligator mississippiensis TaxID=8496 RepID=A0A151N9S9_ALLMI|nr:speriolin-like protein isoform A [Alligator mississippiensis]
MTTEDNEWMKRLQKENTYLKNQVRLLRENYELRSLLGQHYENSSQEQIATSHPTIMCPAACAPSQGVQPYGREIKMQETPSRLHPSMLEDCNYSSLHITNEALSRSSTRTEAQAAFKRLSNEPTLFQTAHKDRKPTSVASTSWTTRMEKQLQDSLDLSKIKKVSFIDGTLPGGDKIPSCLHGMAHQQHGNIISTSDPLGEQQASSQGEFVSLTPRSISDKERAQTQTGFPGYFKTSELFSSEFPQRKPNPLFTSTRDITTEKTPLESAEIPRKKRVWFLESPVGDELRKPHTYYLNEREIDLNAKKNGRIVGEIAFQLDRRILAYVFPGITRLYGYTVSNIPEKIKQASLKSLDGFVDEKKYQAMTQHYLSLLTRLEKMGYNCNVHPVFSEFLINTYGILKQRPDLNSSPIQSSPNDLRKIVIDTVPSKFLGDTLLLLNCLCELSKEDGKPLFAW